MKSRLIILLLGSSLFFLVPCVHGGNPTHVVRTMLDEVMAIQTDAARQGHEQRQARRDAIAQVIVRNFQIEAMAQQSLGSQWESISKAKQTEFREIFQHLFLDSYTRLVIDFLKKEKIDYVNEESRKDGTTVKTIIQRANEAIPVDYLAKQIGSRVMIADVRIDGVSIVDNYQKSFARVIKQESYEGLIKKMRIQQQAAKAK